MINFSINKNLFLQALNTTKRAISHKNAIPILSTVKIDVTNEGITLIGSNGQISIENFISIKNENAGLLVTSSGSILLEATFFINVVSSLPDITLDFKEIDQKQIVLTSGKSEITLKGKDADQYPRIQEISASNPLVLETSVLKNIINETAFAASTQESRPILTGVHFVLTENKNLKTVATDSHRMSQKQIILEKNGDNFDVVIPSRSLREFSAVFTDDIETVEIYFTNNQLLFRSENISFYTRLLEGNYPDTDRLIPTDFNNIITFDTNNLRYAMERARLLSNATQNGTVKLEIINGVVSAHVNSPEVGRVNEEIDTESISGQDLTISFNPTYLIDSLKAIDSEKVTISFISAVRPFTLVPNDDTENFIQLITPVRTN
ncbi:DNA polymerase III subunit beta [Streptococcus constellatus subsp. pharyngis]|uniref:Beta sliding clamp n=4 Tax=Streptococcus TaxID=1301 RepID=F9P9E9_STRCV|nr:MULTISPECIES: DNA polymerase III subunit beta [Streptococcus]AGU71910.1 DNA polymerase III subunit beta [Streptococcus constellatus subsp. pharyngis C232]AGU73666.1 DNA polymerase III subunit beta [Streptococcus constellatus subsp. pharyngis C818]AGU79013.1 DNA polymerase III subunit beta [Streptococcus constellatus subsp. pharyngis C1050]EGV07516.1 DNA polymerase III, beta subunit [Streptococcus constellatus subsp. pharyngis SK1060 = CCUG 46377]EID19479.1 DNA polymerase III, beta subunit [